MRRIRYTKPSYLLEASSKTSPTGISHRGFSHSGRYQAGGPVPGGLEQTPGVRHDREHMSKRLAAEGPVTRAEQRRRRALGRRIMLSEAGHPRTGGQARWQGGEGGRGGQG
ncbi:hypothetical protein KM043_002474 [Ampulex compressa]|nr:hypothetical protein KM043_002474 [Ampulex compressa]